MIAMRVFDPGDIANHALRAEAIRPPEPGEDEVLIRIDACGVCRTDLHIAEGDIKAAMYPITPGHQVVGRVAQTGKSVKSLRIGDRVGVAWLYSACGVCAACIRGEENLCRLAKFTGKDVNGGFAEFMVVKEKYALRLPNAFSDIEAAPLLCAGIIGYRAMKVAGVQPGEKVGLVGFGASAHLTLQLLSHQDCHCYVMTRSVNHRKHAEELGAVWVGGIDENIAEPLDRAIIFAPAGELVPKTLEKVRPGGVVVINAVFMTTIPAMEYRLLYEERVLRSVANATRQDAKEFLDIAAKSGMKIATNAYPLNEATRALIDLKESRIVGEAVLVMN